MRRNEVRAQLVGIALIGAACAGPAGPVASPRPTASPNAPAPVAPALHPLPRKLVKACVRAAVRAPVLCPRRFPRRTVTPAVPSWSQELDFGPRLFGLELAYSAPTDGPPSENPPRRMLHFVVFVAEPGHAYGDDRSWRDLGPAVFGRRSGHLYFVDEESVHHQHYVFSWSESGHEYQASLHSWDDEAAGIALLRALVEELVPPARL